MENEIKVYIIINKANNMQYIGLTGRTVKQRIESGHFTKNASFVLKKDIKKYGKKNFDYGVLEICECEEDAIEQEKFWIATFNTLYPDGYNLDEGGTFPSESMRDKSSERLREYWEQLTGKKAVKRINIKKINELTEEYVNTGNEVIWDDLTPELYNIIDIQLGKNYTRVKELWDDLRQDIIINLWENRKNVGNTCSHSVYNHYYNRIRGALNRATNRYEGAIEDEDILYYYKNKKQPKYNFVDMNMKGFDELTSKERKEVRIQPIKEEWEKYED